MHERRVFVSFSASKNLIGEEVELSEADSKHLVTVLRLSPGDPVTLVHKETSREYQAFVASVLSPKRILVKIDHQRESSDYHSVVSVLAVGMCKAAATETIIEKATELGVESIALIITDHSVVRLKEPKEIESKKQRFNKIALEAARQSSRTTVPNIQIYLNLQSFLEVCPSSQHFVGSLEEDAQPVSTILSADGKKSSDPIIVYIGPEGDFSASEVARLKEQGSLFFSLGGNRLRAETAALAAIAAFDAVARR